jgi:hypothetical protein
MNRCDMRVSGMTRVVKEGGVMDGQTWSEGGWQN